MGELGLLVLAGTGTALATGLGAIPVFALGRRADALRPLLWGLAAGVMAVASVVGLLAPALDEGSTAAVAAGLLAGVAVPARRAATAGGPRRPRRRAARRRRAPLGARVRRAARPQPARGLRDRLGVRVRARGARPVRAARDRAAEHPRGNRVRDPDAGRRLPPSQQFWAAVATSAPQPVGAVIAYILVEEIESLLPVSFAFAAGAMLALVALELVPQAFTRGRGGWRSPARPADRRSCSRSAPRSASESCGELRRPAPRCAPMAGAPRGPSLAL